ncbi:prolipoprotein diacylglyceryl transferase [Catenulispora subtropica]|uniref:Phosphatidylglycerol--prolipoprotein diacylglyceryl transferase n=1 Tax=Catenulispora subtropica TaxID=450798 RepID=A0ABN2TCS4_9ACTN
MSFAAAHQVATAATYLAEIPSPTKARYNLGPIPIRMYAMCILAGILVAVWLGDKRWRARGGKPQEVVDIAIWAVPFGLVGGRLYHVITTSGPYFGKDGDWVKAFYVWEGGLGIWGAIALGALGAYIGCRRRGASLRTFADAVAPGIVLAQALGRWGNWFNNELYGGHTDLPWGLKVHVMDTSTQRAIIGPDGKPELVAGGPFHPTFLYESLWCVGVAVLCIWADRRFKLGYGRVFALYVASYTVGRFWIESLRTDEAHHFLGMRLNDWTAILVFLGAVAYFLWSKKKYPGREASPYLAADGGAPAGEDAEEAADAGDAGNAEGGEGGTADETVGEEKAGPEKLEADPEAASDEEETGDTDVAERVSVEPGKVEESPTP